MANHHGDEASAYYAAGTAAYHINADITYAIRKYALATLDEHFLLGGGVDVAVETARMWLSLGDFSERKGGAFCINDVTGPDEYTAVVDNNRFTNMMARENLRAAVRAVNSVRQSHPADFERLVERTRLDLMELDGWERAADRMYLPVDESTGIHPRTTASSTSLDGNARTSRPTSTRCCSTTIRSRSTATRSSSRPTW